METNPVPQGQPPKNNRNMIIGVVIALVLCCCCIVTGVGGYYGYQAYVVAQQVVEDIEDFPIPSDPNATPGSPSFDTSGEVPEGGLADEQTRVFAWASVQLVGIMSGCNTPTVEGTTITVTQQPDAGGIWYEDWNVNCGDGSTKTFPIKFTPENGVVNVEVEFQP
ncbi:MAG: hypothetical protein HYU84_04900 [Chloroflexi bacterium]|nr:hypothetical protein [Chloroflexota bacterium]